MLQHNADHGRRAHLAHAAVMGLHALCCGIPALAIAAAALSGAASGIVLVSDYTSIFHHFLHAHEVWILVLSAALVITGGTLEVLSRRGAPRARGFPWLFAFSVFCFAANFAIIAAHRGLQV
jgi:uncharacterized membrane protein HdeD (DUF308 family)